MTRILRQSTQVDVRIGPFVDVGDGFTPETGITLSGADEAEALRAGTATLDISGATWAPVTGADGWYTLTLSTTATNTVGELVIVVQDDSVCLPVYQTFYVVEEAIFDALFAASATGLLPANVTQFGGSNGTFASGRPEVNMSHIAGSAVSTSTAQLGVNVVNFGGSAGTFASGRPAVNTTYIAGSAVSTSTAQIGVNVVNFGGSAGTFSSGRPEVNTTLIEGSDATNQIRDSIVDDATRIDASALNTLSSHDPGEAIMGATDLGTGSGFTAIPWNAAWDAEVQSEVDDALVAQNLDHLVKSAVDTDFATTVHANSVIGHIADNGAGFDRTTDSLEAIRTQVDAVEDDTNSEIPMTLATIAGVVDAILTDTGTTLDGKINTIDGIVDDILSNTATIDGKVDTIDGIVDAILVDTAEIGAAGAGLTNINLPDQTMNITGDITGNLSGSVGSVTGLTASDVAAIKAKTDGLTFTVSNQVDANIKSVAGTTVTGSGTEGDPWGP